MRWTPCVAAWPVSTHVAVSGLLPSKGGAQPINLTLGFEKLVPLVAVAGWACIGEFFQMFWVHVLPPFKVKTGPTRQSTGIAPGQFGLLELIYKRGNPVIGNVRPQTLHSYASESRRLKFI